MSAAQPLSGEGVELEVCLARAESEDAVGLVLRPVRIAARRLTYEPGQFLTLRIPRGDGAVARCYSLASAPGMDETFYVVVKRVAGGYASNWLCDHARRGLRLQALGPAGLFVPPSLDEDLLLIAGGSGITPIFSIAKTVLLRGRGRLTLVDVNRDRRSIILGPAIDALIEGFPERFTAVHWLTSERGRPDAAGIERLAGSARADAAFVCGPAGLMEMARQALQAAGFPRARIHLEAFMSLSGDPFLPPARAKPVSLEGAVALEVDLDGIRHRLQWAAGTSLLDALLDNGVDAPHFCRDGACGTCTCTLRRGRVRMKHPEIFGPGGVSGDPILACQSIPDGVDVGISY